MRQTFCVLLAAIGISGGAAVAQPLEWATSAGGANAETGRSVAVDAAGNSCVVGTFVGEATAGAGELNQTMLLSAGAAPSQDAFVAKYDASGALLWARGIGGVHLESGGAAGSDFGWGVATDASGNCFVAGTIAAGMSHVQIGGLLLATPGAFAARFGAMGNLAWFTNLDPAGGGHGVAVDLDAAGNVYVAGSAPYPGVGSGTPTLWKLTSEGGVTWTRQAALTGTGGGRAHGLSVDADGVSRTTGRIQLDTFVFGEGEANETTLVDDNTNGEMFVAAYAADGTLLWADQSVSTVAAWGEGIALDADGNSYVTGPFNGMATFDAGGANSTTITAASTTLSSIFVAKYDADGVLSWVQPIATTGNGVGTGIAANSTGLYVTGWFGGTATLAAGEPEELVLGPAVGGADVLLAKYDTSGALLWARSDGGDTSQSAFVEQANAVAVNELGHVLVAGDFPNTATFGTGDAAQVNLTSAGQSDVFLAKYVEPVAPPPAALDLDIAQFRVRGRVAVSKAQAIDITLVVENTSPATGAADATVVGTQGGVEVYRETIQVSDAPGNGRSRFSFPTYIPTNIGTITWEATIADADPDVDSASAATTVVP